MSRRGWVLALLLTLSTVAATSSAEARPIVVGSKNFTEGRLLGELLAQRLEAEGFTVERRLGLGGTLICYQALTSGEIDLYVEYTGTLREAVLPPGQAPGVAGLRAPLGALGLELLPPLGFNNTYALALAGPQARALEVTRISQLASHPTLRAAFSHEFLDRRDGWRALKARYGLSQSAVGIDNALAYQSLEKGQLDLTDANSTDGELLRFDLRVLDDDLAFFPEYQAVPLVRSDFPAAARAALAPLGGRLGEDTMRRLNAAVAVQGAPFAAVAAEYLKGEGLVSQGGTESSAQEGWLSPRGARIVLRTREHLQLTGLALLGACLLGIPLAVLVHRRRRLARVVLYLAGLAQTIPSLALLALMIPLLGIGAAPAIVALLIYAVLPILRNTLTALLGVDPTLRRVALAMGLTPWQQLRYLVLPLALPTILAGVRTATVISLGAATLAAFVGAGGLGEPIVTGISLNNTALILEGALPAAALALLAEWGFEALEARLVAAPLRRDPLAS
jgi:osmoprotectant transport system permease protein